MSDKPVWREMYDRVSAEVSPRLTDATASDGFAEAVEVAGAITSRTTSELERRSRRMLHAWNLPSGSDIAMLRQELGSLTREVRALSRQVEQLQQQLASAGAEGESDDAEVPAADRPNRRKAG